MSSDQSFNLDLRLLDTQSQPVFPGSLAATLNAHGSYETFRFVLRLSPLVHSKLASLPTGIVANSDVGFDGAQAFSTYLHETIHWWQHIGSTFGLLTSLTYPTEAHANYKNLITLAEAVGFRKPIRQLAVSLDGLITPQTPVGLANIIINNQFDFNAFRHLTYSPEARNHIVQLGMFESMGHAIGTTYGNVVFQVAQVADPTYQAIPKPDDWYATLMAQREEQVEGYHFGSPVTIQLIGALEIMEGQARFSQIQYLHFSSGGRLEWDVFETLGLLGANVYTKAFETFLTLAQLKRPKGIDDPIIGLFLIICDMALNPGSGFPFPVHSPMTFIKDVDPGERFNHLCCYVRVNPDLAGIIRAYSRDEYAEVSQRLALGIKVHPPLEIAKAVADWPIRSGSVAELMDEWRTFKFKPINLPVRFILSHFIAFMADKLQRPEFFCWPGAWMAGERVSEDISRLFDIHRAPFLDKEDDDGVFPRTYPDKDEIAVRETFQGFYAAALTYDMTCQWITEPGPFHYRYNWLVQNAKHSEMKEYGDRHFQMIYKLWPDDVKILINS